ncbi:MAG: ABC transporter permease, partial [Pseudomonadota bacterium]
MGSFILRRSGVMLLTAFCLTFIVFFMTNLFPNLEKLAKTQGNFRMSEAEVTSWLGDRGYLQPTLVKYAEWVGVKPGYLTIDAENDRYVGRCVRPGVALEDTPRYCGLLQGNWGFSTVFKDNVSEIVWKRLGLTGFLMFWVMLVMVPGALIIGVLAGMREGSRTDRSLSTVSIASTATPEYVSGVIFIAIFTSSAFGLKWFKGSATKAMEEPTLENFTLPVITIALYGMGYIARMTRASMAEVMTAQYVRTARLKGVSFRNIVM